MTASEYRCPNCGGTVVFNAQSGTMKCPYCDSEYSAEEMQNFALEHQEDITAEQKFSYSGENVSIDTQGAEPEAVEYKCSSCGGDIIGGKDMIAATCPYCGSPVIMAGHVSGMLRPDVIIPFSKTKDDAKAAYINLTKHKRLLPDKFLDNNHIDEIKGMYVPFWLYTAESDSNLVYDATTTRSWSDSDYDYTETSHYKVTRSGTLGFTDVPVDGSAAMPDDIMESVEPFDEEHAKDFITAYFAGFFADKYDRDFEADSPAAYERMTNSIVARFAATAEGYSSISNTYKNITFSGKSVKYAMYPVWMLTTTYKNKRYTFAMNGDSGKLVGNLPVDWGKFWLYLIAIGVILTVVVMVVVMIIRFNQMW